MAFWLAFAVVAASVGIVQRYVQLSPVHALERLIGVFTELPITTVLALSAKVGSSENSIVTSLKFGDWTVPAFVQLIGTFVWPSLYTSLTFGEFSVNPPLILKAPADFS